jgi:hypothetical protein
MGRGERATRRILGIRCHDLYNRQLHPDERQWVKDNAAAFAKAARRVAKC